MKTEQYLRRVELEFTAIDNVYSMMRYLGFRPQQDTWKSYCRNVNYKLNYELINLEFIEKSKF